MIRSKLPACLLSSFILVLCLLPAAASESSTNLPVLRYEEPAHLTAAIYAPGSSRKDPLFSFTRHATRTGNRLTVLREYRYPDGRIAARETAVYQGNALLSWDVEELQVHAGGRAVVERADTEPKVHFEYDKNLEDRSTPKKRAEDLRKDTLISDMVGPFLLDHWDALMRGEEVKCRYIVVPRTETVGFTFEKVKAEKRETRDVVIIKMSATSPIISALVDPLFFTIEKGGKHRVLEYQGRTTPKLRVGNKWKDLDAVTVFNWPQP
jgi:hypothetical protein